ncbi:MAG: M28 family peptidase [Kiritimatiellaeota bacterium]|nr:M28 family peptidase [Kiritimatiellota bacterium]
MKNVFSKRGDKSPPESGAKAPHSIAIALLLLLASCSPSPPPLLPFPPDFTEKNAEETLALVYSFCEQHPSRDSGTPGALTAANWISSEIFNMLFPRDNYNCVLFDPAFLASHPPRIDTFTDKTPTGPLTFHNVLAELPAKNSGAPWIVLISHYDTKSGIPNFVGANDGASSTALLLSLHRLFAPRNLPFNFLFAFLDGEECQIAYGPNDGLHGSKRLAAQLKKEGRDVRAVIVLDMIGDADLHIKIPANCTPDLRARALEAANKAGTRAHFSLSQGAVLDDHVPFLEAGFPALNFIDFDYGPNNAYWHTAEDTPDKLSANSFLVVAKTLLQLIADL